MTTEANALSFLTASALALAQQSTTAPSASPALANIDTIVKIVGSVVAALATVIGLPIVFLTYRKTRVEISKLELEARALQRTQADEIKPLRDDSGNIRIVVDRSSNTNVQVLADPRFLAPLLILLDFILAWIILELAGYLFGMLPLLSAPALAILATLLLLPIARQVLRVRAVLSPPSTTQELHALQRQLRITAYVVYATLVASSLALGAVLLIDAGKAPGGPEHYTGIGLLVLGLTTAAFGPFARKRFNTYLSHLYDVEQPRTLVGA